TLFLTNVATPEKTLTETGFLCDKAGLSKAELVLLVSLSLSLSDRFNSAIPKTPFPHSSTTVLQTPI
ncbi:hypothetical protein FWF89_03145, partial [Candidatus Saccharibacteria bacterium]|nr:hypothetical protein [Candidatus Saccharibacteria bacterium]